MAEEYCGGPNWWDTSTANRSSSRFDGGGGGSGGGSSSSSTTTTLANTGGYGWLTEGATALDINAARSPLESVPSASSGFQDAKMDAASLQFVGLGLSSQAMDWNHHHHHQQQHQHQHHLLRNQEKAAAENSFRSMLQEGMGLNTNFHQQQDFGSQVQWRSSSAEKLFPDDPQIAAGRGFSLDQQPQFSPNGASSIDSSVTCQATGLTPTSFHLDSSSSSASVYGSPSSGILQGFIGSTDHHHNQQQPQPPPPQQPQPPPLNYHHQQSFNNFGMVPQFLRASSPKQQQQQQSQQPQQQQLHFTNNAPYWNASGDVVRPSFFSSLHSQLPLPSFDEKPKGAMEVRETSSPMKKSGPESNSTKRARNEGGSSTLPPFKVRKEKMGDRITALQQLVSPFGKTDTASVLSEAIEYIKFLHEQVSVLSTPYLKSGGSYQQHQQSNEKAKIDPDIPKQDLRSRGLCLVPVSSTFPVTHETTVDFWTPTFGGTYR